MTAAALPGSTGPILGFAAICLGLSVTPGPNMIYLVSRSITQGPRAGLLSLVGTGAAFLVYLLVTSSGIAALAAALPSAYGALRIAGALYLAWLGVNALRTRGSPFEVRTGPPQPGRRLVAMGFLTNLLNPKTATIYVTLLPQFVGHARGDYLRQSLMLGSLQIGISMACNGFFIVTANQATALLGCHPGLMRTQRWLMGIVLVGLAVATAFERTA